MLKQVRLLYLLSFLLILIFCLYLHNYFSANLRATLAYAIHHKNISEGLGNVSRFNNQRLNLFFLM